MNVMIKTLRVNLIRPTETKGEIRVLTQTVKRQFWMGNPSQRISSPRAYFLMCG